MLADTLQPARSMWASVPFCLPLFTYMCRCAWSEAYTGADQAHYVQYHDEEWGVPQTSDACLFEHITLDGAQCGLSWSTILQRRDAYRRGYKDWDIAKVAKMVCQLPASHALGGAYEFDLACEVWPMQCNGQHCHSQP